MSPFGACHGFWWLSFIAPKDKTSSSLDNEPSVSHDTETRFHQWRGINHTKKSYLKKASGLGSSFQRPLSVCYERKQQLECVKELHILQFQPLWFLLNLRFQYPMFVFQKSFTGPLLLWERAKINGDCDATGSFSSQMSYQKKRLIHPQERRKFYHESESNASWWISEYHTRNAIGLKPNSPSPNSFSACLETLSLALKS